MSTRGRSTEAIVEGCDTEPLGDIESAAGKLVYLYLATAEGATTEELKGALDLSQLHLYPILRTLEERGLIDRSADRYVVSR